MLRVFLSAVVVGVQIRSEDSPKAAIASTSDEMSADGLNWLAFCALAGAAADRETTRALMARIGDAWDAEVWKERKYFDGYRKWAGL